MPVSVHRRSSARLSRPLVIAVTLLAVAGGAVVAGPSGRQDATTATGRSSAPSPVRAVAHEHDDHDGLRTVPSIQREIAELSARIKGTKRALRRCDDRVSRRSERACERRAGRQVRALKRERARLREQLRRGRRPSTPGSSTGGSTGGSSAGTGYALMWSDPTARWRCTSALTFKVNPAYAPSTAVQDVRDAFALIGRANGYSYTYLGSTTATGPSSEADIIVSWTPGEVDNGGAAIAVGGASASTSNGRTTIHSGFVRVESGFRTQAGLGTEGRAGTTMGRVLVHEIGHVMGLGHVNDRAQIMYGTIGYQTTAMNSGDRAGFVRQGRAAACA